MPKLALPIPTRISALINATDSNVLAVGMRDRAAKVLSKTVIATLLLVLLSVLAISAEPGPASNAPTPTAEAHSREAWRATMSRIPLPKKDRCFKATYPNTEWSEVPCGTPPNRPYPPARGAGPEAVGAGNDWFAQTSETISSAVGCFGSGCVNGVTVTSETGNTYDTNCQLTGSNVPNVFSLQLNTNTIPNDYVPTCKGAANPTACKGWQQFAFTNTQCEGTIFPCAFIQYWMFSYDKKCPTGWGQYTPPGTSEIDCWINGTRSAMLHADQTITSLGQMILTGQAASDGDAVIMYDPLDGSVNAAPNPDKIVNLSQHWHQAEFNVFGASCASQANFNAGSTIVVSTSVNDGTTNAPSCQINQPGHSGETNNLMFVSPCSATGGARAPPAIVFTESNVSPAAVAGPFVNTFIEHGQDWAYRDEGGLIWDAYFASDLHWHVAALNLNGPPAVTDAQGTASPFVDNFSDHPAGLDQDHLAYRDNGGVIWDYWFNAQNGSSNLQRINLCPKPTGDPSCGATAGWTNGPQAVAGPFVNTFVGLDQQHFAYRDSDGGIIWDSWYDNHSGHWNCQQINGKNQKRPDCPQIKLGKNNGQPAVEGPFVDTFYNYSPLGGGLDQQHFAYRDNGGVIWDYWFNAQNGSWNLQRINLCPKPTGDPSCSATAGLTNGPQAVAGPFVNTFIGLNQQHFAYRDNGGIIWDSWYDNHSGHWNCQQINGKNQNRPGCPEISFVPGM